MTTKTEKKAEPPKQVEKNTAKYACHILLEKTTLDKAQDNKFPTDAFIVRYVVDGKELLDVTRSEKMSNIFDMYYDKFGSGSLQTIEYGYGIVRPNLWNIKPPERKKRKRRPRIDE